MRKSDDGTGSGLKSLARFIDRLMKAVAVQLPGQRDRVPSDGNGQAPSEPEEPPEKPAL